MGDARRLWIPGPAGRLEASLRAAHPSRGRAIVAHPHPLHGGTLHNPVIFHTDRELNRAGFTTLRFNFRGTGESEGEHDSGRGEVGDLAAAVSWMQGVAPPGPMLLVGYSFGSLCAYRYLLDERPDASWIAIGLPVRLHELEAHGVEGRFAVVQGTEDEFGDADEIRAALEPAGDRCRLELIDGATHLFPGQATEVASRVVAAASWVLEG